MSIRLSTVVEIDKDSEVEASELAKKLRVSFNEAVRYYPAMRQFLVKPNSETEIVVGVMLEDVVPRYAEDMANEIIDYVLDLAMSNATDSSHDGPVSKRDSVSLAFA